MFLNLQKGALLIADAHYPNHKRVEFLSLLKRLKDGGIQTQQLILMGDIFDLLVGNSPYLKKRFQKEIHLLEEIAKKVELIYLEGNHDFYLNPLFGNAIKIVPRELQPLLFTYKNKSFALSHGDKYEVPKSYTLYSKLIRNPLILKLLPDCIAKYKLQQMQRKKICKEVKNFNKIVSKIKGHYQSDYIIEGHYHQGVIVENYISLPSFACSGTVSQFNGEKFDFIKFS